VAHATGATLLAGGKRDGAMHDATLLENVPAECDVVKEEVFGPVVVMSRYATFKDAITKCVVQQGSCDPAKGPQGVMSAVLASMTRPMSHAPHATPPWCCQQADFGAVHVAIGYARSSNAVPVLISPSNMRRVNDSKFGLQAGIFTHDMDKAFYAFEHLEVTLSVLLPILRHSTFLSTSFRRRPIMQAFMPRDLAAAE